MTVVPMLVVTDALLLLITSEIAYHVRMIHYWCNIGDVCTEPCEHGLPRCPHCNGTSIPACDSVTVTQECQNQDVSTHAADS